MLDLNLLRTFVAVAETTRISRAAARLDLPKSTISRHVSRLEQAVDAPLFVRRSDGLELTAAGRRLFQATRDAVRSLNAWFDPGAAPDTQRPLRVQAPVILGRGLLSPLFAEFLSAREGVSLDVRLRSRFDLPDAEEIDLAFLVGATANRDFESWPLGSVESRLYAAPSLFAEGRAPQGPAELRSWPLITGNCVPGGHSRIELTSAKEEASVLLAAPRILSDDADVLLDAAGEGLGILRVATFLAEPRVRDGRLVPVLPEWWSERFSLGVARSRTSDHPASSDLADFVATRLRGD